jgi:hypothetical protein
VEGGGDGVGAGGVDAAEGHALVLGLEDDADAVGGQVGLEPVDDLGGESFLELEAVGE